MAAKDQRAQPIGTKALGLLYFKSIVIIYMSTVKL